MTASPMLLGSDFDGTLCRNGRVCEEDLAAIARWREEGHLFVLVTGRFADSLPRVIEWSGGVFFDLFLCCSGAHALRPDGSTLFEARAPARLVPELDEMARRYSSSRFRPDEADGFRQYSVRLADPASASRFTDEVNARFSGLLSAYQNGSDIDVAPWQVSKATGLARLAACLGVAEADVCTVGDSFNDLSMLRAFNGFVVDTAAPEVKELWPKTCKSVGELLDFQLKMRKSACSGLTAAAGNAIMPIR